MPIISGTNTLSTPLPFKCLCSGQTRALASGSFTTYLSVAEWNELKPAIMSHATSGHITGFRITGEFDDSGPVVPIVAVDGGVRSSTARLFSMTPAAASPTSIVFSFLGSAGVASLDLATEASGNLDTVVAAVTEGTPGNNITVTLVADSLSGVTLDEVGNAVTIHIEDGVSTVADVETSITSDSLLLAVQTPGTGATVLAEADEFANAALTGGSATGNVYNSLLIGPAQARTLAVHFAALWGGGDVTVTGTDMHGMPVTETFTANAGSFTTGLQVFATVSQVSKANGSPLAAACSVGTSTRIGLSSLPADTVSLCFADDVAEACTINTTYGWFEPTTAPNGVVVFKVLVNV